MIGTVRGMGRPGNEAAARIKNIRTQIIGTALTTASPVLLLRHFHRRMRCMAARSNM